jgi:NlpC/P60 family putative phage cell wall peptidase
MGVHSVSKVINEARGWIGTPWRAGQRKRGVSCDCVGFVVGVFVNLGLELNIENYSQTPTETSLREAFLKYCEEVPLDEVQVGDVLIFKLYHEGNPTHVGFYSGDNNFIHADGRSTIRKVVEVPLGYWKNRIVTAFRFDIKKKEVINPS